MDFLNFKSKNINKSIDDKIAECEGKNEGELMDEIFLEANKLRNEGKLNEKELEKFYTTISPMLNEAQKNKLQEIIRKINV